ncbi:MAG: chloramphenicol acetyltransferase [Oscillospiraceae bacterium]|nr:chloramphenicol acetyltransferase [Oscillospiraceae bacterium]
MKEIDPKQTPRAAAFEMWMNAPMPMVTLFKTLDVTRLLSFSRKYNLKFNMLMCYCIGRAASQVDEFYLLPVGGKLINYDKIAVNTVVNTRDGNISTCDIPFSEEMQIFNSDYLTLTKKVCEACQPHEIGDNYMVIGTSALVGCDIDGAVNIYAGVYNNPFVIWGKYRKKLFKTFLPISFQFHHTQMDGGHAAKFLECLQNEINII